MLGYTVIKGEKSNRMKKILTVFTMLVLMILIYAPVSVSAEIIDIDEAHFPDARFRKCISIYDKDEDEALSESEIRNVTDLYVEEEGISDLTGIEYFTELLHFGCEDNDIRSIDLSKNVNLEFITCSNNKLSSLDLTQNTKLRLLQCDNNLLSTLNVNNNVYLA